MNPNPYESPRPVKLKVRGRVRYKMIELAIAGVSGAIAVTVGLILSFIAAVVWNVIGLP